MTPSEKIRERILSALQRQEADPALAAEYARLCDELNRRIEQIEEVLDRGDEIQALQMAEIAPPVMEEADTLSFFQSREWGRLCQRGRVSIAPEIRAHGIALIDRLYGKGLTPNHPIYRELREAILARDDARALQIARIIESLDPKDPGARSERERLERKVFLKLVTELGKALSAGDEDLAIHLLDEVEGFSLAKEVDVAAEILSSRRIREKRNARAAMENLEVMFPKLEEMKGRGDWQGVAEMVGRIRELTSRHSLDLDAARQATLENTTAYVQTKRTEAERALEYSKALRSFLICLDDATSRTQASGTLTIAEVGDLLTRLNKAWQIVQSFGMPVDLARVEETSRMVEKLRNELARLQKNRVLSIAALAAAVLLLLTASGWYLTLRYRVGELMHELSACRESRSVSSVRKLVAQGDGMRFASLFPKLITELESCRNWARGEESSSASAGTALADLLLRSADFSKEDPLKLEAEYQAMSARVKALPPEQQKILQADLGKLDKAYGDHLAALAAKEDKKLEGLLAEFDKLSEGVAGEGLPLAEIRKNLETQKKLEAEWAPILRSPIKDLPLSASLKAKAEADEEKTKALEVSVEAAESALAAMAGATQADAFRMALGTLKAVNLPSCNLIPSARIAWNTDCTEASLLPDLLFPGNPSAFRALKNGDAEESEAKRLSPKAILPNEVAPFALMLNDEITPEVRACKLEGGDPSRTVYIKSAMRPPSVDDPVYGVYTLEAYDPATDSQTSPAFTKKTYRANSKGWERAKGFSGGTTPSNASKIYGDLGLKDAISDSLEVKMSVLQLLDRLSQSPTKDTVYQAYVIQQLAEMTSKRPLAWGLQYSPGASTLMKEVTQTIRTTCGSLQPTSWMAPAFQKLVPALKLFLDKPRHFNQEAQLNKWLAENALVEGEFLYAGYVQEDGTPHLSPGIKQAPAELFGIAGSSESRKAACVFSLNEGSNPASYEVVATPVPLTPLFYLKHGQRKLVADGVRIMGLGKIPDGMKFPPLFAQPEKDIPIPPKP